MTGYQATHSAAEKTLELVGRRNILAQIEAALTDTSHTHVIVLTGDGGMGKTMLLRHVLKQHKDDEMNLRVAKELIDLYHPNVHSITGFIRAAMDVLAFDEDAREEIVEAILDPKTSSEEVGALFVEKLNHLAQTQRVFITLDTAERVAGYEDPVQRALGLEVRPVTIWQWLTQVFLPQVQNTVILLAGRPQPRPWWEDLASLNKLSSHKVDSLSLKGFTEAEAMEYIEALISSLEKRGRQRAAHRLHKLTDKERQLIFYALCNGKEEPRVRPIFLALALDYRSLIETWPQGFPLSVEDAQALSSQERTLLQEKLWKQLIGAINAAWYPGDIIVQLLGWLPKGADEHLLIQLGEFLGIEAEDIRIALKEIQHLSFVKLRPNDKRYFLHDEMYDLLAQYGMEPAPETIEVVLEYYKKRISHLQTHIKATNRDFITASSGESSAKRKDHLLKLSQQILDLQAQLHDALVEDLSYYLRKDLNEGLKVYYRYVEEAVFLNDESLDMQLRTELYTFLGNGKATEGNPLAHDNEIYSRETVRWVRRLVQEGKLEDAEQMVEILTTHPPGFFLRDDHKIQADLQATAAVVKTYRGNYQDAEKCLTQTDAHLQKFPRSLSKVPFPLNTLRARYYNNLGYLRRTQGQFWAARNAYKRALPYWRGTKMEAEHANTLTNLAYVQALVGEFDSARRHVKDALELRLRLGFQAPIALTLNTWAQVELLDGHYEKAEQFAQQALTVADQRAAGLTYITLASCYRFWSESPRFPNERAQFLQKAMEYCNEAIQIFSEKIPEPERLAEAYYVRGLVHRERCQKDSLLPNINAETEKQAAEQDLRKAMEIALQKDLKILYLDAMMGLAWLYYHVGEKKQAKNQIEEFDKFIDKHFSNYRLGPDKKPEVREDTQLGVFSQLGRKHVLQGVLAMDRFWEHGSFNNLKEAAWHFALGKQYDHLIADKFRDLRRAENTIHSHLKRLNTQELKAFYEGVRETMREFSWCEPEKCHFWRWLEEHFGPYEIFAAE